MRKFLKTIVLFQSFLLIGTSCGSGNIFNCASPLSYVKCEPASPLEEAQKSLNNNQSDRAIELLEQYQLDHPGDFSYYPLLAAAYAQKAGIDIFKMLDIGEENEESEGAEPGETTTFMDTIGTFLPSPTDMTADAYQLSLTFLAQANTTLEAMPEEQREDAATYPYAASAKFQLSLYTSAYGVMFLNQFVIPDLENPGEIDLETLSYLSAADAAIIIDSFTQAAGGGGPLSAGAQNILTQIENSPGDTTEEKIQAYVQNN
ncbi:MAG: hypothetical protein KBD78_09770 [Oligoflexales bacterium]|nr:hypothetical protein [Oligoflexales bacterium]